MSLVKTGRIGAVAAASKGRSADGDAQALPKPAQPKTAPNASKQRKTTQSSGRSNGQPGSRREKATERIAAATDQLASGLAEASAAAEELRRSMEQIAAGADEAAAASQEQSAAVKNMVNHLSLARSEADSSRRRAESLQLVLTEAAEEITASTRGIDRSATRQRALVEVIAELERRADEIGEITQAISGISDQTNLLALNAAIEAARAGEQGRGFAVVADEVRALAETSEKSSLDVQRLADGVKRDVQDIVKAVSAASDVASGEAKAGASLVEILRTMQAEMATIATGSQDMLNGAAEAERAASEVQRGAEQVASAADEQSSAASEAQVAIREQAQSLDQAQLAAQTLGASTEQLRSGADGQSAAEKISAGAEQLSATMQELSTAASQIMAAVEQISRGSQLQASATHQTSAALAQIEKSAALAQTSSKVAGERVASIQAALVQLQAHAEAMVAGVGGAIDDTRKSLKRIGTLESLGREIDKIVDRITLVAVQTSMLAVSGAVEAARAGEDGRGFGVVSNDIRSLAREASESADRIKDTVRGIIDQIALVRGELEQLVAVAEAEVEKNISTIDAIRRLDSEVASLTAANIAILRASDGVLSAATETAAGARQIAAAAEEASSATRQAATASAQQAQGAEDLAAAIEEIGSLANELNRTDG